MGALARIYPILIVFPSTQLSNHRAFRVLRIYFLAVAQRCTIFRVEGGKWSGRGEENAVGGSEIGGGAERRKSKNARRIVRMCTAA